MEGSNPLNGSFFEKLVHWLFTLCISLLWMWLMWVYFQEPWDLKTRFWTLGTQPRCCLWEPLFRGWISRPFYCAPLVKDISHHPDGKQRHKESSVAFLESSQLPRSDKSWIRVKASWPSRRCSFQHTDVIAATCISQTLFSKLLKCRGRKEIMERSGEQALHHIKLEELSFKTKQSRNANSCILVSGIPISKWVQFLRWEDYLLLTGWLLSGGAG